MAELTRAIVRITQEKYRSLPLSTRFQLAKHTQQEALGKNYPLDKPVNHRQYESFLSTGMGRKIVDKTQENILTRTDPIILDILRFYHQVLGGNSNTMTIVNDLLQGTVSIGENKISQRRIWKAIVEEKYLPVKYFCPPGYVDHLTGIHMIAIGNEEGILGRINDGRFKPLSPAEETGMLIGLIAKYLGFGQAVAAETKDTFDRWIEAGKPRKNLVRVAWDHYIVTTNQDITLVTGQITGCLGLFISGYTPKGRPISGLMHSTRDKVDHVFQKMIKAFDGCIINKIQYAIADGGHGHYAFFEQRGCPIQKIEINWGHPRNSRNDFYATEFAIQMEAKVGGNAEVFFDYDWSGYHSNVTCAEYQGRSSGKKLEETEGWDQAEKALQRMAPIMEEGEKDTLVFEKFSTLSRYYADAMHPIDPYEFAE